MPARTACVLPLALVFAGCATNLTGVTDGESALANLRAENKGLVLIDTDLHDRCGRVLARVAHPDADGHYVRAEEIALKRILNRPGMPTEVQLPAGDYGIVELDCESGPDHRVFMARATKQGNILTGEGTVYDRPIATFSVRAGEFVDIGSLRLPSWSTGKFFGPQAEFKAYALPIDDIIVAQLALAKPAIYSQRVQRLMTTADAPPGPDPWAKPAPPHHALPAATDPDRKG